MANIIALNETKRVLVDAGLNFMGKTLEASVRVQDKDNATNKTITGLTDTVQTLNEIMMPHVSDYSPAITISNDIDVLNSSVGIFNVDVSNGAGVSVSDKVKIGPLSSTVVDGSGTRTDLVAELESRIVEAGGTLTIDTTTTWGDIEAEVPGIIDEYSQFVKVAEVNGSTITTKYFLKKNIYSGFSFTRVANTGVYELTFDVSETDFAEGDKVIIDINSTDGTIVREGILGHVRTSSAQQYEDMANQLASTEAKIDDLMDQSFASRIIV